MAGAEEFLETIWDDLYFFVLALSAGGRQLVGPPGGGRAGAAVSPPGWGVRAAEKLGAAALPWCAVVPSADQSGRRPGGLVGCASRVVASAIRLARPTLMVSTAFGLTPRCSRGCAAGSSAGGLGLIQCSIGLRDERGLGRAWGWGPCVLDGRSQQDEEFFPACFELISGRCDSDARRCGSG